MTEPSAIPGLERFPRVALGHLPTSIEAAPNLTAALGGPRILIKRDDCTGLGFGGNKVRQLEFYMGDARVRGADTVLIRRGAVQFRPHLRRLRRTPWDGMPYPVGGAGCRNR